MDDELSQDMYPMSQLATVHPWATATPGKGKHFNCCVHGFMRLDATCVKIIDTPQFQRLRELKQLGCANYVFPTAVHTRFDHSLGTCHLAGQFAQHIYGMQGRELGMEKSDITCVAIAGLCHDLGHGPFSHVFDHICGVKGITGFRHEEMGCRVLDSIIEQLPNDTCITEDDIRRVKAMMDREGTGSTTAGCSGRQETMYLYDIVSNQTDSIDVDKFDYLARDSHYCGMRISFDHKRPMAYSKVLGGTICYKNSEYQSLHELFHSRELMHRQVYTHKKAKSVEFMITDVLMAADKAMHFFDHVNDADAFTCLDDTILRTIEMFDRLHPRAGLDDQEERALKEAQSIITRLRSRKLYRFCNELKLPTKKLDEIIGKKVFTPAAIVACHRGTEVRLREEDVIVSTNKINWAKKEKNPLDMVTFFDDFEDTVGRQIKKEDALHMITSVFQEHSLRVYSRDRDPAVCDALASAFGVWKDRHCGRELNFATPVKARMDGGGGGGSVACSQDAVVLASMETAQPANKRKRSLMPDLEMEES
ncbi:hypothetical protein FOA52_009157 [Chlamydomonas sp. UWO 241]|nr:hypothetical protein FOA52_009157 [Chlamydomonas sp. UWO 241]